MIAEINHKCVDIGSEDQLTGNVFGALRYLPYSVTRQIIIESVLPVSASAFLEQLLPSEIGGEWGRNVYFWRRYPDSQTEPDIVMELGQVAILIEVKFNSELSGNDQLIRETELLTRNYPNKEKILILLAREQSAISIFNDHKSNIPADISFGYITWQRLFDAICKSKGDSLVCKDMAELLNEKGFSGFRGFGMMNEETIRAFRTVREAHKNVQKFISRCIALADEKGEFELAPMTGNNTFLRWSSDRDSNAWSYSDFIMLFQRCCDAKLKNGYRNGALYVLDINFDSDIYEVPTANIARYDYDNIAKNWSAKPISPSDHWIIHDPMYQSVVEFPEYESMYCGEADEPLERYRGLKRVMGYEIPLSEITADNAYEIIFGTFKKLAKKE
jgi:hypothetical protein